MKSAYQEFMDEAQSLQTDLLGDANVVGVVNTPITGYTPITAMIDFLAEHHTDKKVRINLKKLSVNGTVKAEPMENYLAAKELPSSGLKEVLKNPASFFFYLNDRKRIYQPEKAHFQLGTFIHMAILEPALFRKVKVEPKASMASTEGCKLLCRFYHKLNRDKIPFDFDSKDLKLNDLKAYIQQARDVCKYTMIMEDHKVIVDIVKKNYQMYGGGIIPMILKGAKKEASFYSIDKETGIKVKVRPDAFNIAENIGVNAIISVKTTAAESVEKFMNDTARFGYELSEGMYQEVVSDVTARNFDVTIMIMLQTVAPFLPAVIWWTPEDLQNGKYKYHYALTTARDCLDKKMYPGFESLAEEGNFGIISIGQPRWAQKLLKPVELDN